MEKETQALPRSGDGDFLFPASLPPPLRAGPSSESTSLPAAASAAAAEPDSSADSSPDSLSLSVAAATGPAAEVGFELKSVACS